MNKNDFFNGPMAVKQVTLPDGRQTYIRKLSEGESRHLITHYLKSDKRQAEAFAFIACKCTMTADGVRVFDDADQAKMSDVPFDAVKAIAEEVIEYSGMNKAADDPKNG